VKKKTPGRIKLEGIIDKFGLHVANGRTIALLRQHLQDRPELLPIVDALDTINRRMYEDLIEPLNADLSAQRRQAADAKVGKTVELEDDTKDAIFRTLDAFASEQRANGHSTTGKGWRGRLAAAVRYKGKPHESVDWRTLKTQLPRWGFTNGEADLIAHLRTKEPPDIKRRRTK